MSNYADASLAIENVNSLGGVSEFRVDGHKDVISLRISTDSDPANPGKVAVRFNLKPETGKDVQKLFERNGITITESAHAEGGGYSYVDIKEKQLDSAMNLLNFSPLAKVIATNARNHAAIQNENSPETPSLAISRVNSLGAVSELQVKDPNSDLEKIQLTREPALGDGKPEAQGTLDVKLFFANNKAEEAAKLFNDMHLIDVKLDKKEQSVSVQYSQVYRALEQLGISEQQAEQVDSMMTHAMHQALKFTKAIQPADKEALRSFDDTPPAEAYTSAVRNPANWKEKVQDKVTQVLRGGR